MKKPISTEDRAREKSKIGEETSAAHALEAEVPARAARRARAWEADVLGRAADLAALDVDVSRFLGLAAGAEWRVQEWLRLNGLMKHDLLYHVHEALADLSTLRAPSVQEALIDLGGWREDGCAPDALDDVTRTINPPRPVTRGVKPGSFTERKQDEDDRDSLAYALTCLRPVARLPLRVRSAEDIRGAMRWGDMHPYLVKLSEDLWWH